MKGKKIFTSEEVFKIKELIRLKLQSSNNEQKASEPRSEELASIGKIFIQKRRYLKWNIILKTLKN